MTGVHVCTSLALCHRTPIRSHDYHMTHHDWQDVCDLSSEFKNNDRCGYCVCRGASQCSCAHDSVTPGRDETTIDTTRKHQSHKLTDKTTKSSTCAGRGAYCIQISKWIIHLKPWRYIIRIIHSTGGDRVYVARQTHLWWRLGKRLHWGWAERQQLQQKCTVERKKIKLKSHN